MVDNRLHRQPEGLYTRPRYVVKDDEIFDIISREHVYGVGHAGRDKTWAEIDRQYYGITKTEVTDLLKHCASCALTKPARTVAPLESIVVEHLWERLQIDLIDYRHTGLKYKWCLHIRDHFSKFSAAFAMENKESETVAFFLGIFIGLFGAPGILQCDNGTEFKGACLRVIRIHGIPVVHSKPRTPQTNGLIEQANGVLKEKIRCWMNDNQSRFWWLAIPECIMAMNRQVHGTTGRSPYEIVFKQQMSAVNRIPAEVRSTAQLQEIIYDNAGLPLSTIPTNHTITAPATPTPGTVASLPERSPPPPSYEELLPHHELRRMLLWNVALRIEHAYNNSGPYYDWFSCEPERNLEDSDVEWDHGADDEAMLAHFGPGSNGVDAALWALAASREAPGAFSDAVAETEREATLTAAAAAVERARKAAPCALLPLSSSLSSRGPPPPLPPRPSPAACHTPPPRRTLTPPTPPPPPLRSSTPPPRRTLTPPTPPPPLPRSPTLPPPPPQTLAPHTENHSPVPGPHALQDAINQRLHHEVRESTAKTRKRMELRHNTVRNVVRFQVGDLVRLKIPAPDKNTTDNKRIFCRIIAIPHRARYQLLCQYGILKGIFATKNMDFLQTTIPNNIPASHIGQPTLTLRAAAHLQSETDIRQVKCACRAACDTIRCRCFKANIACTLHCHGREPTRCCTNLRDTGLENQRVEPRPQPGRRSKRQREAAEVEHEVEHQVEDEVEHEVEHEVENEVEDAAPGHRQRRSKRLRVGAEGTAAVESESRQQREEEDYGADLDLEALDLALQLYDV